MLFGNDLVALLYFIPILLFSVAVHEFAHAYSSFKLGDRSQLLQGRLTLDPIVHLDIFGFISILLVGFGWGKPVYVDDTNFKNKTRDNMLVSLAGPISNLLIAIISTLILKLLILTNAVSAVEANSFASIIIKMLVLLIEFNIIFAVFNMIPLPPFDGSKVLLYFLPHKLKGIMYMLENYSFYIIITLFITGIANSIITPVVNFIENIIYSIL